MGEMKLVVIGAAGRMGRTLVATVKDTDGVRLHAAIEREGSIAIGQDAGLLAGAGHLGVEIGSDIERAIEGADGIIDFTAPATSVALAGLTAKAGLVHVIGTTGLSAEDEAAIERAAASATIVKSGNMSLGVNLLAGLVRLAARALPAEAFDIEVLEMHHRHKVDAPSGTALLLGDAAAAGRGIDLGAHAVRARDGHTGARPEGAIGFATLRGGSVVGDHSVVFAGDGERIELVHRAEDRSVFARGAVRAALWARGRHPASTPCRTCSAFPAADPAIAPPTGLFDHLFALRRRALPNFLRLVQTGSGNGGSPPQISRHDPPGA